MDKTKINEDCGALLGLATYPMHYDDIWKILNQLDGFYEEGWGDRESPWNNVQEVLIENSRGPNPTFTSIDYGVHFSLAR